MNNSSPFFKHSANAHEDLKLVKVKTELGNAGYGIYFQILEHLRLAEPEFKIPIDDIDALAKLIDCSEKVLKQVIADYGLFDRDDEDCFYSTRFLANIENANFYKRNAQAAAQMRHQIEDKRKELEDREGPKVLVLRLYDADGEEEFVYIGDTTSSLSKRLSGKIANYAYEKVLVLFFDERPGTRPGARSHEWSPNRVARSLHGRFGDLRLVPSRNFKGKNYCFSTACLDELELALNEIVGENWRSLLRSPGRSCYIEKEIDKEIDKEKEKKESDRPDPMGKRIDHHIETWNNSPNLPHCQYTSISLPELREVAKKLEVFSALQTDFAIEALDRHYLQEQIKYRPVAFHRFVIRSLDRWLPEAKPDERYRESVEDVVEKRELTEEEKKVSEKIFKETWG